jgi:predicted esterase
MVYVILLLAAGLGPTASLAPSPAPGDPGSRQKKAQAYHYLTLREQVNDLFGQKKLAEAAELCRNMIGLDPRAPGAHFLLARALVRLEKKDEALASMSKAADLGFDEPADVFEAEDLAPLREEMRYRTSMDRIKANEAARAEKAMTIPGVATREGAPEGGLRYRLRMSPVATRTKPQRLLIWMHPSGGSMDSLVEPLAPRLVRRGFALLVFTKKDWVGWSSEDVSRMSKTLDAVAQIEGITDDRPVLMGFSSGAHMALDIWESDAKGLGGLVLEESFPVMKRPDGTILYPKPPEREVAETVPILVLVNSKDRDLADWAREGLDEKLRQAGVPLTIRKVMAGDREWLLGKDIAAVEAWLAARSAERPDAAAAPAGWRPPALR